jgi:hypothetical protein
MWRGVRKGREEELGGKEADGCRRHGATRGGKSAGTMRGRDGMRVRGVAMAREARGHRDTGQRDVGG